MLFNSGDRVRLPHGTCIVVCNEDGLTTGDTDATVVYDDTDDVVIVVDDPSVLPECQRSWNEAEGMGPGNTRVDHRDITRLA